MDLGHAEFGVVVEKHASLQNGQFVLGPVPQLPQILVVERVKGVIPGGENARPKNAFVRKRLCALARHLDLSVLPLVSFQEPSGVEKKGSAGSRGAALTRFPAPRRG